MTTSLLDRLKRLQRDEHGTHGDAAQREGNGDSGAGSAADNPAEGGAAGGRKGFAAGDSLRRLEQALGTEADDNLSLKVRLERLVAVAAAQRPRILPQAAPPIRLEEAVAGTRRENARGEYFVIDHDVHVDSFYGSQSLSRLRTRRPGEVSLLTGDPQHHDFDISKAVYLDTETTGLSGGTGTAAFLIGIGWLEGDRFRVRQFFMRDYHEEAALLQGLSDDLSRFERLVTYNGKMFDVPLLETRYRLARTRFPLQRMPHLDLLHPARRLFKLRQESCKLTHLEAQLLGVRRHGDIPGHEIPWVYFEYVRRRDARAIQKVLEHNRLDIVSLAALSLHACDWLETDDADDPRDAYSLGRVLHRAGRHERSQALFRQVADSGDAVLRVRALMRLARHARRGGELERAAELWTEAAAAGEPFAHRSLAIHFERRVRDYPRAAAAAEAGLARVAAGAVPAHRRLRADFHKRLVRLRRLIGGTAA